MHYARQNSRCQTLDSSTFSVKSVKTAHQSILLMPKIIRRDAAGLEQLIEVQSLSPQFTTEEVVAARARQIEHDPKLQQHLAHFKNAGISEEEIVANIRDQLKKQQDNQQQPEQSELETRTQELQHISQHTKQPQDAPVKYGPSATSTGTNMYGMATITDAKGHDISVACPCGTTVTLRDEPKNAATESLSSLASSSYSGQETTATKDIFQGNQNQYVQKDNQPAGDYIPNDQQPQTDYAP